MPFWLEREARHAVAMCPALALRVEHSAPLLAPGGLAAAAPRSLATGDMELTEG